MDSPADAANNAAKAGTDQFNQTRQDQMPWMNAGSSAVNQLSAGLQPGGQFTQTPNVLQAPTLAQLQMDPGYAWRTQQGVGALTAAGAAAGNLGSGALGTALINYGQGAGSQEYQSAFDRFMQTQNSQFNQTNMNQNTLFNRLSGVAGTGQTAVQQVGALGADNALNNGQLAVGGAQSNQNSMSNAFNSAGQVGNQIGNYAASQNALSNYNQAQTQQYNTNAGWGDSYTPGGDITTVDSTNWG